MDSSTVEIIGLGGMFWMAYSIYLFASKEKGYGVLMLAIGLAVFIWAMKNDAQYFPGLPI